ncbi:MAG: PilZ domain-containing protein [Agarilytica sp.]
MNKPSSSNNTETLALKQNHGKAEKREFFRISQDVVFDYKVVESFAAENDNPESEFEDAVSLNLIEELRRLDRDSVQTLRLLSEKNRLLGDYLQTLSSKIDLIARHTLFANNEDAKNNATTRINLSEDGIAFNCDRALYKSSYIAVRLVFLPSYSPVIAYAKILRCDQKGEFHQVAARFHRIQETARQEISKQILKAQITHRKKSVKT